MIMIMIMIIIIIIIIRKGANRLCDCCSVFTIPREVMVMMVNLATLEPTETR